MLEAAIIKAGAALAGPAGKASWEKLKRQDRIVKILQKLRFLDGQPPPDFAGVYAYALVLFGVGKSPAVLDFFRHEEVVDEFRKAFETNDQASFDANASVFLEWNRIGDALRDQAVDVQKEVDEFFTAFRQVASLSRTPAEVLLSQQVSELLAVQEEALALRKQTRADLLRYRTDELERSEARYRQLALASCDIIDLAGLPEQDRHVVMANFVMRQLYVPLRLQTEAKSEDDLQKIESARASRRQREAGRTAAARTLNDKREPIGDLLGTWRRIVVLGDPGGGKSTLMRWLATAYLLRLKNDQHAENMPDIATLPKVDFLPIVIQCRYLDHGALTGALDDMLRQTLRKSEMSPEEAEALPVVLRNRLSEGRGLLLIDGLDEIPDARTRIQFCKQIERISLAFPEARIVATSRIVGYREMKFRIGNEFVHTTIAELSPDDKNVFAQRWCSLTEPEERRARSAKELTQDIHSTDRIERLTGNPMLLTTMALVKRKVGKLPSRRAELYREAVQVLLNWRREVDEPLDPREALPQLEYLAYEMCRRGEQSLTEPEALDFLERIRREYPNIRAIQKHSPEQFLQILENRTSIIVQSGTVRRDGQTVPVYEFRHLTFQEYLAGLAIVEGRFPGHDKNRSLAERVSPLAALAVRSRMGSLDDSENWREALRLCVASCNDDDVDAVLDVILTPETDEIGLRSGADRALLAGLCLADEPNVNDETGRRVVRALVHFLPKHENPFYRATIRTVYAELAASEWKGILFKNLLTEYISRAANERITCGDIFHDMTRQFLSSADTGEQAVWLRGQTLELQSSDERRAIPAALQIQTYYFQKTQVHPESAPGLDDLIKQQVEGLIKMLDGSNAAIHTATWTLAWIVRGALVLPIKAAFPNLGSRLIEGLSDPKSKGYVSRYFAWVLGALREDAAVQTLIQLLKEPIHDVPKKALEALSRITNEPEEEIILTYLRSENREIRLAGVGYSAKVRFDFLELNDHIQKILSVNLDKGDPWWDPLDPIDADRLRFAALGMAVSEDEIRKLYETAAEKIPLKLTWRQQ